MCAQQSTHFTIPISLYVGNTCIHKLVHRYVIIYLFIYYNFHIHKGKQQYNILTKLNKVDVFDVNLIYYNTINT